MGDGVWAVLTARGGARRGPWFAALLLGMCLASGAIGATRASAAVGELSFLGCLGQLTECSALSPAKAVEGPKGVAVSPDGANVYVADQYANAVDVFSRNTVTGTLTFGSCVGELPGCTATNPEKAVEGPFAVAVSPDGANVYVAAVNASAVDEFSRNAATGALTFTGCVGKLAGCTTTSPAGVSSPDSIAVSADGSSVYAAAEGGSVDEFQRNTGTGALTFEGCLGSEVSGCTAVSKPNSLHALGAILISPDGTSVYAGGQTGSIATFTRNTSTGALVFTECTGYLPECNQTSVHFVVNEPISLAISPDGANLYAANANNGVVVVLSRDTGTGKLAFLSCNGHYAEEPAACSEEPAGHNPEGFFLHVAMSPDGADVYLSSDEAVNTYSRGVGGALSFAGCIGNKPGVCAPTEPVEAVFRPSALTLSPNGANVYSGDELSHVIDVFGRATLPTCSDIQAAVPYATATPLQLTCSSADGRAVTYAIASAPSHGSLGTVSAAGQVTYTPAAGYTGADSFTFTASDAGGTATAATAHITVGQPPASPPSNQPPAAAVTGTAATTATTGVASTAKAVEELLLGCSSRPLVLNDVYIQAGHVAIRGSAAKSLVGKKVKILFNERKQVATATVLANGQYSTTAPLPPARIREALTTRYTAEIGKVRSLHLKLTRRLLLEPPKASGTTVTLTGQVTLPLTKPIAPVVVEQQLECGKTTIAKTFTPPASGRFHITITVPANAKAGIYRLTSKVAANKHSVKHGFTTFSLPLPVVLG